MAKILSRILLGGFTTVLLLVIWSSPVCYAQLDPDGSDAQNNIDQLALPENRGHVRTFDNRYQGVKGTPFYNDNWIKGNLSTEDGRFYKDIQIKYNSYEDEIMARQGSREIYVDKTVVKDFSILSSDGRVDYFVKLRKSAKKEQFGFFKVLHDGSMKLFEKKGSNFMKADYQGGYSSHRPYDEFVPFSAYYVFMNEELVKVKGSAAQVAKLFPDKNSEIKQYITTNSIDCKSALGLKSIFAYYDSL